MFVTAGFVSGGIASAVITSVVFPSLLEAMGFASVGVEAGSSAALWQSTFPLVKAGSLFAKLQSISMTGVGTTILPVAIVGGEAAAANIRDVCQVIDDVDPESTEGEAISTLTVAVRKLLTQSNETITYVWEHIKDGAGEAKEVLVREKKITEGKVGDAWEYLKDKAQEGEQKLKDGFNDGVVEAKDVSKGKIKYAWEYLKEKEQNVNDGYARLRGAQGND